MTGAPRVGVGVGAGFATPWTVPTEGPDHHLPEETAGLWLPDSPRDLQPGEPPRPPSRLMLLEGPPGPPDRARPGRALWLGRRRHSPQGQGPGEQAGSCGENRGLREAAQEPAGHPPSQPRSKFHGAGARQRGVFPSGTHTGTLPCPEKGPSPPGQPPLPSRSRSCPRALALAGPCAWSSVPRRTHAGPS